MRRLTFAVLRAVVCGVVFAALVSSASVPATADAAAWVRPVPGRVARPFQPPKTRYGPGHLGVDFAVPARTFVRAAGAGVVTFAGDVAHSLHVVILHANGWRTSYSFLATLRTRAGARVEAGQVVGTTGGTGEEHDGTVLHLGLRIGDEYVDPMQLFAAIDLSALVHLAPIDPSPAQDRAALLAGLPPPADDPVMCATWARDRCQ